MKKLLDIKNYILIHNGEIITKEISEDIVAENSTITVNQATNLQIVYTGDMDIKNQITIQVISPTLDLIETLAFSDEASLHRKLMVPKNGQVTRYVNHLSDSQNNISIHDFVEVEENGNITCAYVDFSDTNIVSNVQYDLIGKNAQAKLRLAALSKQEEKKQFEVHICHLAPHTTGSMDNYGIVKDSATLHIDGIGTIKQGNHQSDNQQINKILVFNPKCVAIANPYLYIDEYDVNAGHGASVGKVDEEQLYYLQSRGLSQEEALHLITYGYFIPVLEFIRNEEVKEQYNQLLKEKVGI
ncbi:MAG: SufD family Fe-S cluster assembly protein [Coprobacillaceae bacterium]